MVPFCRKLWLKQRAEDASLHDAELLKEEKWGKYNRLSLVRDEHRGMPRPSSMCSVTHVTRECT